MKITPYPQRFKPTVLVFTDSNKKIRFDKTLLNVIFAPTDKFNAVVFDCRNNENYLSLLNLYATGTIPVIVLFEKEINRKKRIQLYLSGVTEIVNTSKTGMLELSCKILNLSFMNGINSILINENAQLKKKLNKAKTDIKSKYLFAVKLGTIAEFKSNTRDNHIRRVSEYARILAGEYGLNEKEQEIIWIASSLHDIGKACIPDHILNKPDKLTAEEFEIIKTHTVIGRQLLETGETTDIFEASKIIAEQHHERYDGNGYPYGIKGQDIHIYARITAICDVFDALTSIRVYKDAVGITETIEIMRKEKNKHFDGNLLTLFFNSINRILAIKHRFTNN